MISNPHTPAQILDTVIHSLEFQHSWVSTGQTITVPESLQNLMCEPGLMLLSAQPTMGCTSLALNISICLAKYHDKTILYFSYDASKETLIQRMLCMEGFINADRLSEGNITCSEESRLDTAAKIIRSLPIYIYDDPLITIGEIRPICDQFSHIDLVIIDDLQNIQARAEDEDHPKRVKKENRLLLKLATLAKEKNIPILCLNTLRNMSGNRVYCIPDICDIQIYRKSFDYLDKILFLYQDDFLWNDSIAPTSAFCNVRLNRKGNRMKINMHWLPQFRSFIDTPR